MRSNFKLFCDAAAVLVAAVYLTIAAPASAQSTASAYTSATRYDLMHRVVGTIAPDPDAAGSLKYAAVRNSYDAAGRLTKVEKGELSSWKAETVAPSAWGASFTMLKTIDTVYDGMDRKLTETVTGSDGTRTLTQYSYDPVGRLECTAVRMNAAVYGSLPSSACSLSTQGTNGPDRITRNVYDDAGQLTQLREGVGTLVEAAEATYSYTDNGRKHEVIDGEGNRAELVYDGHDRLSRWNFPSPTKAAAYNDSTPASALSSAGSVNAADYEEYGYDANGNRTSLRKRDGSTLTYAYDGLNRVTQKTVPSRTGLTVDQTRDVYYGYDAQGHQLYAQFDSAATGSDGVTNLYDGFGALTSSTLKMGTFSKTLTAGYDADGNRTSLVHPEGTATYTFTYAYDGLDRLSTLYQGTGTTIPLDTFTYNNAALPISRVEGSAAASSVAYGWDRLGRLTTQSDDFYGTTGDVGWTFAYTPGSQIATETRDNDAYAFTTSQIGTVNRDYAVNGLNQYTTAGPVTFAYDGNANLTGDGTWTYTYDIENRLVKAASGSTTVNLIYDPLGRLYQTDKGTSGTTARFLYDGDALVLEYNSNNTVVDRYVHGSNAAADDPLVWYDGNGLNTKRWLHADHLGSIVGITDTNGHSFAINSYDEYGINGVGNQTGERFGYTGQAFIPDLGMYYYKARFYSPTLGRFLQTDPIGYEGGINIYAYVGNDPANKADPTGEEPLDWVHGALTAASFCPSVCGSVASAADGVVSAIQGDRVGAGISFAAAGVGLISDAGVAKVAGMAAKETAVALRTEKTGATIASDGQKVLFRRGAYDTKALLKKQSADAEKAIGRHGVSVTSSRATAERLGGAVRCATCSSVEAAGFKVTQTGRVLNHHTVELPKPITSEVARLWNDLFK